MDDSQWQKHEREVLIERGRDQIPDNAKGEANVDRMVKKVLAVSENASSDSVDEIHNENDGLILKGNEKRSYPINETNRKKDAIKENHLLSRCHKVKYLK